MLRIFSNDNFVWNLLHNISQSFYVCNVVPRVVLKQHWIVFLPVHCCAQPQGQHCIGYFFLCIVVWSFQDNIAQGIYLSNVVSRLLRQHWTVFFPVHCFLEPQGQQCTGYLPVQCCLKSIKATLNRISSVQCCLERLWQHCTRILPVPGYPKSIKTTLKMFFSMQCCLEPLEQHCTRVLPVQCWPMVTDNFYEENNL